MTIQDEIEGHPILLFLLKHIVEGWGVHVRLGLLGKVHLNFPGRRDETDSGGEV